MLQRSMYKPLFTSSSSRLFTFIYLSLFFICWFSSLSGSEWESVFLRGWFVHIYQPEMKYALWGIPAHLYLSVCVVMALSKAQSCPRSSSAWLPPVLHLSFQIDSIFTRNTLLRADSPGTFQDASPSHSNMCHNFPSPPAVWLMQVSTPFGLAARRSALPHFLWGWGFLTDAQHADP